MAWKKRFPRVWREFVIADHRADIKSPQGVIELQASGISVTEVGEREAHYGEMVWLLDARDFDLVVCDRGSHVTFRWRHPHKTWWYAAKPIFFDVGDKLIEVRQIYEKLPCRGWGRILSYSAFVHRFSRAKPGDRLCEDCHLPFAQRNVIKTGMYEYCTMDIDPETFLCGQCYEKQISRSIPDDPSLFDVYTPAAVL